MRRWVPAVVLLVAGLLGWALWPDDEVSPEAVSVAVEREPSLPPVASVVHGGRVSGVVLRDGQPVAKARVTLRSTSFEVTTTLEDGRFLFAELKSGQLYLSASTADAASEVVGPLQLLSDGVIEGVTLTLAPSVSVDGRVIDLLTQKPVAGATVISASHLGKTDENGTFTLRGARTATWLEVTAPGFLTRTEWVTLELVQKGGSLELVLTPASRLEGTVTEDGAPVGAASVWAEAGEGPRRGERSQNVFTDQLGRFSLECGAGTVHLSAVTPRGVRAKGPTVRIAVGEKKTGLTIETGPVSSVEGVVTRGGQPVAGASLSAIEAQNEALSGLSTTTPAGQFRFDGLPLGSYTVQVRAGALTAVSGPFVHSGDGRPWVIELQTGGVLRGKVEPAGAGVVVRWRSGQWSGPSAQTVTDATGAFTFEGLPNELVSVDAEGPAGAATTRAKAGDEVLLRLQKGAVVAHLVDDVGRAVTDGVIIARSLDTGSTRRELVLAPDGVVQLTLASGTWELVLEVPGRGRSQALSVTVGVAVVNVTLKLEPSVAVSGRVVDKSSGLPVERARIEAQSGEYGRGSRLSVLTDARGEFQLPPVPSAAGLHVIKDGFRDQWRRAADGARWEIALDRVDKPGQQPAEMQQFEGVGMTLDARAGPVTVMVVSEGSPAERAGVVAGDQILAIDGVAVTGQPLNTVVARIRGPSGTPVRITFQRQAQTFELTLRRKLLTL